jgi:hypothetical protein
MRKWRRSAAAATPQLAYAMHRRKAKARDVPFLLTFEEWWSIWRTSGKWEQRGRRKGQYVMARFCDVGPYAVGNVRICTNQENNAECIRHFSPECRQRMSESRRGRLHSAEARAKISATKLAKRHRLPA